MKKYLKYSLIIVLLAVFYPCNSFAQNWRVLYLNSYSPDFPTSSLIVNSIRNELETQGIYVNVNFLYTKEHNDSSYFSQLYNHFEYKLSKEKPYDLIISSDDHALKFIQKHHSTLFRNLPVVFFGINDFEFGKSFTNKENYTGFLEQVLIKENIDLMQALQPELNTVIAICDNSVTGQGDLSKFYALAADYPHLTFSHINPEEHTIDELKKHLISSNSKNTAYLLIAFYKDKYGNFYPFRQSTKLITDYANAPVYHLWLHGKHTGITAGAVIDLGANAQKVANIAIEILNGKSITDYTIQDKVIKQTFIDYQKAKEFKINVKKLPKNIVKINEGKKTYSFTQTTIRIAVLVVIVFLFMYLLVILSNRKLKKIEKELKVSNTKYINLFDNAYDLILIIDAKTKEIVDVNKNGLSFLKTTKELLLERKFTILFEQKYREKANQEFDAYLSILKQNKKPESIEAIIVNSKGESLDVEINAQLLNLRKELYIQASFHDLTYIKKTEKELIISKNKAEESDKLKSAFLANMSHEIRTPMNAIIGFSQLIAKPGIAPHKLKRYNNLIQNNCFSLLQLINDIIDIAKIEAGQLRIKPEKIDVFHLFIELEEIFHKELEKLPQKNVKIIYSLDPNLKSKTILTDYVRLKQVFINLIGNALKFTDIGYVKFGVHQFNEETVKFYVEDTGEGISAENMKRIFNRFEKINYTSKNHGGTGLGLTISQNIVRLLNGQLEVKSTIGKGSTFSFVLPLELTKNQVPDV